MTKDFYPDLSLARFAQMTVACVRAHTKKENDPQLQFLCKSLALGRKIIRHTRTAVRTAAEAEAHIQRALVELFGVEPDLELKQDQEQQDQEQEEPQAQAPINVHTCSLQSLGGY